MVVKFSVADRSDAGPSLRKTIKVMFKELHQDGTPLLLANVWDVPSAQAAEAAGYRAIGTSSAAMASAAGYADGEDMPFAYVLEVVKQIRSHVNLPLSVDLEAGYGKSVRRIADNILKLHALGVVGVNLEDSLSVGIRGLRPAEEFAKEMRCTKDLVLAQGGAMFFNIRTDPFLLSVPSPIVEAIDRIRHYERAGADGIFIPGITDPEDIRQVVSATSLPINVMCMPGLPDFDELEKLGVRRISMGNFPHEYLRGQMKQLFQKIAEEKSFVRIC